MDISNRLNTLMKENNIKNPKELSKKLEEQGLKIPYTTLLTYFNNDVKDIKIENAKKLADYFEISLDTLCE